MGIKGHKISTNTLLELNKLLKRADRAMNVLEKANGSKMIYPELKKDLQNMIDKLDTQYALKEFTDPNARNRELDKARADVER